MLRTHPLLSSVVLQWLPLLLELLPSHNCSLVSNITSFRNFVSDVLKKILNDGDGPDFPAPQDPPLSDVHVSVAIQPSTNGK